MGGIELYRHAIRRGHWRARAGKARSVRRGPSRIRREADADAHRTLAALLTLLALLLFAPALARSATRAAAASSGSAVKAARTTTPRPAPVRAAYFYDYMPPAHLDTLAALGFDRAVIHTISDSVGSRERPQWIRLLERGKALGIDVVPEWLAQSRSRIRGERRYIGGEGSLDPAIPCPLDSLHWRLALIDRTEELASLSPRPTRVAIDLEMNRATRTHWNAGACRCRACLAEFAAASRAALGAASGASSRAASGTASSSRSPGDRELLAFEERRIEHILTGVLEEFARRFPGVELGVLDLDRHLFPYRALGRALARTGVPTADYSECSYTDAAPLDDARRRLDRLGLGRAPLYGGLWLQRFPPEKVRAALESIDRHADGFFVFTTYSLWQQPARLAGPYTLKAPAARYVHALAEALEP